MANAILKLNHKVMQGWENVKHNLNHTFVQGYVDFVHTDTQRSQL